MKSKDMLKSIFGPNLPGQPVPAASRALLIAVGMAAAFSPTVAFAWDPGDVPPGIENLPKGGSASEIMQDPRTVEKISDHYGDIKNVITILAGSLMGAAAENSVVGDLGGVISVEAGEVIYEGVHSDIKWGKHAEEIAKATIGAATGEVIAKPIKGVIPGGSTPLEKVGMTIVKGIISGIIKVGTDVVSSKDAKPGETITVKVVNALLDATFDEVVGKSGGAQIAKGVINKGFIIPAIKDKLTGDLLGELAGGLQIGGIDIKGGVPAGGHFGHGTPGNWGHGGTAGIPGNHGEGTGSSNSGKDFTDYGNGGDNNDNDNDNCDTGNTGGGMHSVATGAEGADGYHWTETFYDSQGIAIGSHSWIGGVEGNPDPTGTSGDTGPDPQSVRDAIVNGKGTHMGTGASGGFTNDGLEQVVVIGEVNNDWGGFWGTPLGGVIGGGDEGPDAKGNPNPMSLGGDVSQEGDFRLTAVVGKLGPGDGAIDHPRGEFTGGDGSTGPVDDDDKMPNPFDDNSPGGPVSRDAVSGLDGSQIVDLGSIKLAGRL